MREDAFCKPCEHWSRETSGNKCFSAAGRAKKDCSKQDNGVTSYLSSGLLQLVLWKLESVSGEGIFFRPFGAMKIFITDL